MPITKLDITSIQQINLFAKITSVSAKNCFEYANQIFFAVEPQLVQRAIGQNGSNLRSLSNILKKKVKVVAAPSKNDMERFVRMIVYPTKFKKLTEENGQVMINAGMQSKASLIGRDHVKLNQLTGIVKQYFDIKEIKIV